MSNWAALSFFLIAICQPALLIVVYDFENDLPAPLILAPTTLAWVFLVFAQIYVWCKVNNYYKKVVTLCKTQEQYKLPEPQPKINLLSNSNP